MREFSIILLAVGLLLMPSCTGESGSGDDANKGSTGGGAAGAGGDIYAEITRKREAMNTADNALANTVRDNYIKELEKQGIGSKRRELLFNFTHGFLDSEDLKMVPPEELEQLQKDVDKIENKFNDLKDLKGQLPAELAPLKKLADNAKSQIDKLKEIVKFNSTPDFVKNLPDERRKVVPFLNPLDLDKIIPRLDEKLAEANLEIANWKIYGINLDKYTTKHYFEVLANLNQIDIAATVWKMMMDNLSQKHMDSFLSSCLEMSKAPHLEDKVSVLKMSDLLDALQVDNNFKGIDDYRKYLKVYLKVENREQFRSLIKCLFDTYFNPYPAKKNLSEYRDYFDLAGKTPLFDHIEKMD